MITEYLTEDLLRQFVQERFENCSFIFDKSYFKGYRFRQDIVIPEKKLVIEYNGASHYTSASRIYNDHKKEQICIENNYKLINIPYFIQLDSRMVKLLFGTYISNTNNFNLYPHGFIDKKATLPADFCSLGILRFFKDLDFFQEVRIEIYQSLVNKLNQLQNLDLVWYIPVEYIPLIKPPSQ